VNRLTAGDLKVVRARRNRLKYQPDKDITSILNKGLAIRKKEDTGWPTDTDTHRKLMKNCFNRNNRSVVKLIHTTEKIKYRKKLTV